MYHFNENNIVAGYIKEVLHNFELPTCPVFVEGRTEVYPNTNYIYNHSIVLTNPATDSCWNGQPSSDQIQQKYRYVQNYVYGQPVLNLTKHLKLNSILYDTYTHEYLGEYLRFYRDYTGINLMMLYNCFSNRMAEKFDYYIMKKTEADDANGSGSSRFSASNTNYKIYLVPVKFNQKYLVGIDSDVEVEMVCGLVKDNAQITEVDTDGLYRASYTKHNALKFQHPTVFSTEFGDIVPSLRDLEGCLKLCIKLPSTNRSSISVVEVDSAPEYFTQMADGRVAKLAATDGKAEYPSKLSLFKLNDGVSYPFADRLIEYLFGQAITPDDVIGENIERVRLQLMAPAQYVKNGVQLGRHTNGYVGDAGVWNQYIRPLCYEAATATHTANLTSLTQNVYDLTYYIDRDIESLITVAEERV